MKWSGNVLCQTVNLSPVNSIKATDSIQDYSDSRGTCTLTITTFSFNCFSKGGKLGLVGGGG